MKDWVERVRQAEWALWIRQVRAIMGLESRRSLFGRRAAFLYLLALAPAAILSLRLLLPAPLDHELLDGIGGTSVLFAVIFRTFFLRLALFFGCVGLFTRLFRGDVLEGTLHYYFLCPVRREVLVVGKFLAGLVSSALIFGTGISIAYLLLWLPAGAGQVLEVLLFEGGLAHLLSYVGVTILGCLGYGALFLLLGVLVKNPIIPAGIILGWEYINFLLPATLKKISVIYYLESLCPVPIPEGPITILADPAPLALAFPGLLLFSGSALFLTWLCVRRMEIRYSDT